MSKVRDLHEQWCRDPDYRAAYESLGPEFELARSLIEARTDTTNGPLSVFSVATESPPRGQRQP